MIRKKILMQQLKRFSLSLSFAFFSCVPFLKIHVFIYIVSVLRELHHCVVSLWWTDNWMGWVWVVKANCSHQCSQTNKMVRNSTLSELSVNSTKYFKLHLLKYSLKFWSRWYAKRFLHPDIVARYDYIFLWDEDLGVEHFDAEKWVLEVQFPFE